MKNTEIELMNKYGITYKTNYIYTYKQYHYSQLKDAIRYAEIDTKRHIDEQSKHQVLSSFDNK